MIPIMYAKVGNVVQYQVRGDWCLVLEQQEDGTVVLHPNGNVVLVDSAYCWTKSIQYSTLSNDNVTHLALGDKPVCGNRFNAQIGIVGQKEVTCKSCLRMVMDYN